MIKNLFSGKITTMLLATFLSVGAQAQTTIGYTNGSKGRDYVARSGEGAKQGMAIRISKEKLQMLKGKKIKQINVVFGSRNSTNVHAFITESFGHDAIIDIPHTISKATSSWSEIALPTPYTITGEEDQLFIGVSLEQSSGAPLSVDFSNDSKGRNYLLADDKWVDAFGSGLGSVNVQAVLEEDVTINDVIVKDFNFDSFYKVNEEYNYKAEIFNFGNTTINEFDAVIEVDGNQPIKKHFSNIDLAPASNYTIDLPPYTAAIEGHGKMNVRVENVNGKNDDDMSDNSSNTDIFFYPENMERALLVEEFTGVACVNCPGGQRTLASAIENSKQNCVEIFHHAGYQPDIFTMGIDSDYLIFYGESGQTYAPGVMVNRTPATSPTTPVVETQNYSAVMKCIEKASIMQPYVSLGIATTYDKDTRAYTVAIDSYCHNKLPEGTNVMNVILVQDGYLWKQEGATGDYTHNNICRGSLLNNAWGGQLPSNATTEGSSWHWEKSFELPEAIHSDYYTSTDPKYSIATDPENMGIVVYFAHHDTYSNSVVYNCARVKLGESYRQNALPTGISEVKADVRVNTNNNMYDLSGRRIANNHSAKKGLYIIGGKKYMIK